jgi:hypothetical protein
MGGFFTASCKSYRYDKGRVCLQHRQLPEFRWTEAAQRVPGRGPALFKVYC